MVRLTTLLFLTFPIPSLFIPGVLSQAPDCILSCLQANATSLGCDPTDATCVCNSDAILSAVATCIGDQCSLSDAQAAEGFFTDYCSGATTPTFTRSLTSGNIAAPSIPSGSTSPLVPTGSPTPQSTLPGSTTSGPVVPTASLQSTSQHASTAQTSAKSANASTLSQPSSTTSSTTPTNTNHADRGPIAGSFTKIGFALALGLAAW